ncbi:MAG: DUF4286 family protein [Bacteroidota bacterium]|nr:DUF4286 family protein [Bacteroidota bacterium]
MLLYNVTVGIDQDSEEEWLDYMRNSHINRVLATGLFISHKMYRVLHDSEDGTISYSIQFFARNIQDVQQYLEKFAPALIEEHRKMFHNRHVTFMTLLEEL